MRLIYLSIFIMLNILVFIMVIQLYIQFFSFVLATVCLFIYDCFVYLFFESSYEGFTGYVYG